MLQAYAGKSFEELRWEDYSGQPAVPAQSSNAQQNTNAFGQQQTNNTGFGSTDNNAFGGFNFGGGNTNTNTNSNPFGGGGNNNQQQNNSFNFGNTNNQQQQNNNNNNTSFSFGGNNAFGGNNTQNNTNNTGFDFNFGGNNNAFGGGGGNNNQQNSNTSFNFGNTNTNTNNNQQQQNNNTGFNFSFGGNNTNNNNNNQQQNNNNNNSFNFGGGGDAWNSGGSTFNFGNTNTNTNTNNNSNTNNNNNNNSNTSFGNFDFGSSSSTNFSFGGSNNNANSNSNNNNSSTSFNFGNTNSNSNSNNNNSNNNNSFGNFNFGSTSTSNNNSNSNNNNNQQTGPGKLATVDSDPYALSFMKEAAPAQIRPVALTQSEALFRRDTTASTTTTTADGTVVTIPAPVSTGVGSSSSTFPSYTSPLLATPNAAAASRIAAGNSLHDTALRAAAAYTQHLKHHTPRSAARMKPRRFGTPISGSGFGAGGGTGGAGGVIGNGQAMGSSLESQLLNADLLVSRRNLRLLSNNVLSSEVPSVPVVPLPDVGDLTLNDRPPAQNENGGADLSTDAPTTDATPAPADERKAHVTATDERRNGKAQSQPQRTNTANDIPTIESVTLSPIPNGGASSLRTPNLNDDRSPLPPSAAADRGRSRTPAAAGEVSTGSIGSGAVSPSEDKENRPSTNGDGAAAASVAVGKAKFIKSVVPRLTDSNYFTIPSLSAMARMSELQLKSIQDFTVGHSEYGLITWPGMTDVRGLDLDAIVRFSQSALEVYPDPNTKPAVGKQLNKMAKVQLKGCWPLDPVTKVRGPSTDAQRMARYERTLRKASAETGAEFIDYEPSTGDWMFQTAHF